MHSKVGIIAIAGLAGALAGGSPAVAHPGHTSCKALASEFIVPLAHSGQLGATASALAHEGGIDEPVATQHAALCDPS